MDPIDRANLDLQAALTRRSAILAELAALIPGQGVASPNFSEQGRSVDLVGYRKSLYDELDELDKRITAYAWQASGPLVSVFR